MIIQNRDVQGGICQNSINILIGLDPIDFLTKLKTMGGQGPRP